jgi:general secretion pathway protein G
MITIGIVGLLSAIAAPSYMRYVEKTKVNQAGADIATIATIVKLFEVDNQRLPTSLKEVKQDTRMDPWGRPYHYFDLGSAKGNGMARKDKKLAPLNSDFDLYSVGKDGQTQSPLGAKSSRDDVVRARDGRFVGLATDFDP